MFRQRVPWSAVACRSRQFVRQVHDWASTSSVDMNAHVAVRQCIDQLRDQLEGERPRFMTVFFGSQHLQEGPLIAKEIYEKTGTEVLLGCTSHVGVITNNHDIEHPSSLVLTAWPMRDEAVLTPFYSVDGHLPAVLEDMAMVGDHGNPSFLLFSEVGWPMDPFLQALHTQFPQSLVAGACVFGERDSHGDLAHANIINGRSYKNTLVGMAIQNAPMEVIHSMGVEPILKPKEVTRCTDDFIFEFNQDEAANVENQVFLELQRRNILNDNTILQLGKLFSDVNRKDDDALDDPLSYQIVPTARHKETYSDEQGNGVITPLQGFCSKGDWMRYWMKHAGSCKASWSSVFKKQKAAVDQNLLLLLSQGRGETMHGTSRCETKIIKQGLSAQVSGLITAREIVHDPRAPSRSPYCSSSTVSGIYFPL